MSSINKSYTITEYGGFVQKRPYNLPNNDYKSLPRHTFEALESFILTHKSKTGTEAVELLTISVKRGQKVITAQNYVGVITMKDGTVIEILPKIHGSVDTKPIFYEMLRALKDIPFKEFNTSNLKTDRKNVLEVFILMFVNEVEVLVKQGLKSFYNTVEENERFFKGKLNVQQNIRHNYIHKERFYVQYDVWSVNRPENRLLKSTLLHLRKRTNDDRNWFKISQLLSVFDGVDVSTDYKADFSKCANNDRGTSHYQNALSWCKIFLCGNSFTPFAGSEKAVAFLFPMEIVFESYVAEKLSRAIPYKMKINLQPQDKRHSLFEHQWVFGLRPDIVLTRGEYIIVMDTKWKLLSGEKKNNYNISQEDMYQMYAYGKKYEARKVVLLYPQLESMRGEDISFSSKDGVTVEVWFIDLLDPDKGVEAIAKKVIKSFEDIPDSKKSTNDLEQTAQKL